VAFLLVVPTFAQFITGARGGCYSITSSGRKRYVDHSYCASAAPKKPTSNARQAEAPSIARQFLRGPRGGCYTLSPSGAKRYVAREVCD